MREIWTDLGFGARSSIILPALYSCKSTVGVRGKSHAISPGMNAVRISRGHPPLKKKNLIVQHGMPCLCTANGKALKTFPMRTSQIAVAMH
jgi:hypothetical protein